MDCDRIEKLLSRYCEGDLPEAERIEAADHISRCDRCREAHAAFMALETALIARRDEVPVPTAMADAVLAKLAAGRRRKPEVLRWLTPVLAVITIAVSLAGPFTRHETIEGIVGKIAGGLVRFVGLFAALPRWIVAMSGGDQRVLFAVYLILTASFVIAGMMICTRIARE